MIINEYGISNILAKTTEVYLELCQTSNMELFEWIVNSFQRLIIYVKRFILDVEHRPARSLLVTFCLLLVTFCSLLVSFYSLLVTFRSLIITFCSLRVTFSSLLVTFCSLLFVRCWLIFARCSLLFARYFSFVAR